MNGNAGFLFYKDYYSDVDWNNLDNNTTLYERKSESIKKLAFSRGTIKAVGPLNFALTTTYPGLVLGTGYHHETGVEGEFKIGFYFDYTTGLPVIPGSSVKGALRSVFPNQKNKKLTAEYKKSRTAYIREMLKGIGIDSAESIDIDALELEIFEGIKNKSAKKARDKYLPLYRRDIFHDALPVSVGTDGLFSDDFITPHKNPLKNPIPLKFLKVSPGVTFRFNFDLKNSDDGKVTAADKLKLFLSILLDMGIGAKTNVGYGQFDDSDKEKLLKDIDKQYAEQEEQERLASLTDSERKEAEKKKFIEEIDKHQGKPSAIFEKWLKDKNLKNEEDVARAFEALFLRRKLTPSKKQIKYLANMMGYEINELKKELLSKLNT